MVADLFATHLTGQLSRFYDTFNSSFLGLLYNSLVALSKKYKKLTHNCQKRKNQ